MEHQISLAIQVQHNSMQTCTKIHCDPPAERDCGDITDLHSESPSNSVISTLPKELSRARTPKSITNSYLLSPGPFSFSSPILPSIVGTDGRDVHHSQSTINQSAGTTPLPTQPFSSNSNIDTFCLTTSPRWVPSPHTKVLFWWGFIFPPLWVYGSLHLFPPLRRRLPRPNQSNSNRKPRRAQILSYLSRLRGPFSKGDVEVGTTTVVVVPKSKKLCEDSFENSFDFETGRGTACVSSAERLDAAGIDASEWLRPDSTPEQIAAQLDKRERMGAYHCLLAFLLLSIIVAVSVIISQRIHWSAHTTTSHLTSPLENESNMGNTNLLGTSSHSSPL